MNKISSTTASPSTQSCVTVHPEVLQWLDGHLSAETFPFRLVLKFWDGQTVQYHGTTERVLEVDVNNPSVVVDLVTRKDFLNLVESLMDEKIQFSGEIDDLIAVFCALYGKEIKPNESFLAWIDANLQLRSNVDHTPSWDKLSVNSPQRDREVIRYHYDVSNDFYKLWLDPSMAYSCAHFENDAMTLEDAQKAKLDLICKKLQLKSTDTFLDVGCGWGALLRWAATNYGVSAVGITLSQEQLEFNQNWINELGLQDRVKVELRDYRDLPTEPTFDKVSSVGMVEHVGIGNYQKYYKSILGCLKPGGLFLNHGIAVNQIWQPEMAFVLRYVFPDGQVPPITTYLQFAKDSGWEIVDVDCWRPHYGKTLRCWADNLDANLEAAAQLVGRRLIMWRIYLKFCAQGFENGKCNIYQTLLRRSADCEWNLPMTRANWLA